MKNHVYFMEQALKLARQALERDEFPVGCLLVHEHRIIAEGARKGTLRQVPSELDHAEILALRRLEARADPIDRRRITLYTTLEPCLMCYGALLISAIGTIVYAYEDVMGGGTACDRIKMPELYKHNEVRIVRGICRNESLALFKAFFSRPHINYWRGSLLADYTLKQS